MNIALDACTLINLINGKVLQKITETPNIHLFVGDNLLDQEILNHAQNILLESLISDGKIQVLESSVTISEFLALKTKYDLGDGETETIALCKEHNNYFASDDKKARKCAGKELGQDKVVGTLFLLKQTVKQSMIEANEAFESLQLMRQKGGFLPDIELDYFTAD